MFMRRPRDMEVLKFGWPAAALLAVAALSGCPSHYTPYPRPEPNAEPITSAPAVDPDARGQPHPDLTPLPPNPEQQAVAEAGEPMTGPGDDTAPPTTEPATAAAQEAAPEIEAESADAPPPLHAGWGADSVYNRLYMIDQEAATLTGTIDSVGTFVPAHGAEPGLMLELRAGDGVVAVHAAPLRYLREAGVRFDFGESLTVAGRWAEIDGRRVLLAQAITRGETRIVLRDEATGRPVWLDRVAADDTPEAGVPDTE